MPFVRGRDNRTSLRIRGHDYATPGAYFVTICVDQRRCTLGRVSGGATELSASGSIAERLWAALPQRFPTLALDSYVVMPNHIHGIIHLVGARFIAPVSCPPGGPCPSRQDIAEPGHAHSRIDARTMFGKEHTTRTDGMGAMNRAPTGTVRLGEVVRVFKAGTSRQIRIHADPTFAWQRNYYEHILRNDERLAAARRYIAENPAKWALDPERPR